MLDDNYRVMKRKTDTELLREYVKSVIKEDGDAGFDSYGGMDAASAMSSPYGIKFGSAQDLIKTFVTPFTDVVKTAAGKTKEITRKAGTLVAVSFATIATTLVPIYGYRYKSLFDEEKKDIDSIKEEYKDVYDATNQALSTGDAGLLAFMACPAAVIGVLAAKQAPKAKQATLELLSALTGGYADKLLDHVKSKAKKAGNWEETKEKKSTNSKTSPSDFAGFGDISAGDFAFGESLIREEQDKKKKLNVASVISNKKFIDKALSSQKAVEVSKRATAIYRKTLKGVYKEASTVMKAKSVEDLQKLAKKQIPDVEKLKNLPPEEKQKAEQLLIQSVKKSMKEFYTKNLKDHVASVVKSGIPEDSQYVKDYKNIISKIDSMS